MFDRFTKHQRKNATQSTEETDINETNHVKEENTESSWSNSDYDSYYFEKYEDIIYKDSTREYCMCEIENLSKNMPLTIDRLTDTRMYLLGRLKIVHKLIKKLEDTENKDNVKWLIKEKERLLFLLGVFKNRR